MHPRKITDAVLLYVFNIGFRATLFAVFVLFEPFLKKRFRIPDVKMHSVLRKEVTEYLSRPCAWSKKDENGRTLNYYCYICGVEYNILQDKKEKAEMT